MAQRGFDAFWAELSPCAHVVQIYEDDSVFLDNLAEFVAGGLVQGEAVVVIATPQHRAGLRSKLIGKGIDVARAQNAEQLLLLDAEETMSKFLIDAWPDEHLFRSTIGEILATATARGRKVRAFGEMVAVMWANGYCGATIRLEHLWTELCREQAFSLFCAYPKAGFTTDAAEDLDRVRDAHSSVVNW
jgi:hypothetical protein